MQKDFLDELKEELEALQAERDEHGMDEGTIRGKTMEALLRVSQNHKLTFEEKKAMAAAAMALDGLTAQEAQTLHRLDETKA